MQSKIAVEREVDLARKRTVVAGDRLVYWEGKVKQLAEELAEAKGQAAHAKKHSDLRWDQLEKACDRLINPVVPWKEDAHGASTDPR